MNIFNLLSFFAIVVPLVAVINFVILTYLTRRPSWLILIPPKVYMAIYYTIFFRNIHHGNIPSSDFAPWFRLMVVLMAASTVIFTTSEIVSILGVRAKQKRNNVRLSE